MTSSLEKQGYKYQVSAAMSAIAECSAATLHTHLEQIYHPNAHWRGSHPWNEMTGLDAIASNVWSPLKASLPDMERRDDIVMGGEYEGRDYVGMVGHLVGTFRHPWNGIAANDQVVSLRYGEFHQIEQGLIVQSTVLIDVLDFIRQAGFWPLPPSLGREGRWLGPSGADGRVFEPQDEQVSEDSLRLTLAMQASLGAHFDDQFPGREGLLNMPQTQYWHPKMMWYGPSGVGTTRGLGGFVDGHQLPFRTAFPNISTVARSAERSKDGKNHYVRIGDGRFSATGGWPSRFLTHSGAGWLGLPSTGRGITMRVMDFYAAEDGLIRENWVPIDLIQVLLQLDIDVMARAKRYFARGEA